MRVMECAPEETQKETESPYVFESDIILIARCELLFWEQIFYSLKRRNLTRAILAGFDGQGDVLKTVRESEQDMIYGMTLEEWKRRLESGRVEDNIRPTSNALLAETPVTPAIGAYNPDLLTPIGSPRHHKQMPVFESNIEGNVHQALWGVYTFYAPPRLRTPDNNLSTT